MVIIAPLRSRGVPTGALWLFSSTLRDYRPEDVIVGGASAGADQMVASARALGKPVWLSVDDIPSG